MSNQLLTTLWKFAYLSVFMDFPRNQYQRQCEPQCQRHVHNFFGGDVRARLILRNSELLGWNIFFLPAGGGIIMIEISCFFDKKIFDF